LPQRKVRALLAVAGIAALGAFAVGCGSDSDESTGDSSPATETTGATGAPTTDTAAAGSREQAKRVALAAVEDQFGGPVAVTYIGPEDDEGARWEVEVTRNGGREFDVLVSANGEVIRVITK
jgi:hypothetical protein